MKISEAFREAQTNLWNGVNDMSGGYLYSCDTFFCSPENFQMMRALASSCECKTNRSDQFSEFPFGPQRQGARFMWLEMLALIAEEEGL